jgi:glycosidase
MIHEDELWYKDAIFYEAPVKSFYDANGDGIGDFKGMSEKLDYIRDLGVDCIWILPMFPSPLRDDGYDISSFTEIHPDYGSVDDFKEFLDLAHARGLRVIGFKRREKVLTHLSGTITSGVTTPPFIRARGSSLPILKARIGHLIQ